MRYTRRCGREKVDLTPTQLVCVLLYVGTNSKHLIKLENKYLWQWDKLCLGIGNMEKKQKEHSYWVDFTITNALTMYFALLQ